MQRKGIKNNQKFAYIHSTKSTEEYTGKGGEKEHIAHSKKSKKHRGKSTPRYYFRQSTIYRTSTSTQEKGHFSFRRGRMIA